MLNYLVELVGTFIFLSVIIITGDPLAIGLTLSGLAWFGSKVSGAHYNPAVNVLMLLNKKINVTEFLLYTLAQIIGAIGAFYYFKAIKK